MHAWVASLNVPLCSWKSNANVMKPSLVLFCVPKPFKAFFYLQRIIVLPRPNTILSVKKWREMRVEDIENNIHTFRPLTHVNKCIQFDSRYCDTQVCFLDICGLKLGSIHNTDIERTNFTAISGEKCVMGTMHWKTTFHPTKMPHQSVFFSKKI